MNRGKIVNVNQNKKVLMANIHNKFEIEVIDVNTGKIKQKAQAFNTICNNLWTKLFTPDTYFNFIHYGTGSGTPAPEDTSLFTFLGALSVDDGSTSVDLKNGVFTRKHMIQLTASTAVGATLTEVGIAYSNSNNTLCTHAMLQDMNGNPVSLQKTDTDVVNIYAMVYVHFKPEGYENGCVSFTSWNIFNYWLTGKWNYEGFVDYAFMDQYGDLGYIGRDWYRTDYVGARIGRTFDLATKTVTIGPVRIESSSNPVGGIRSIALSYQYYSNGARYRPFLIVHPGGEWFPYSEVEGEAIGTGDGATVDFDFDFGFVRDATVYIDGVAVPSNEVTVDYGPLTTNNWIYHMTGLDISNSTPDKHVKSYYILASSDGSINPGVKRYFYNPCYEAGIGSFYGSYIEMFASNDLVNWHYAGRNNSNSGTVNINEEYIHYKYWYFTNIHPSYSTYLSNLNPPASYTGSKLHFTNPPAEGAVITADYKTDCIAKNANNVFDFSLVIQVGEYVES